MTTAPVGPPSSSSPESSPGLDGDPFVIGRSAEAERVCEFILGANTRLVALCGEAASGKSVLVRRWVVPALDAAKSGDGWRVLYVKCAGGVPEVISTPDGDERIDALLARRSIIVLDEFDAVLDLPRDERRLVLDRLFSRLDAASSESRVVLVVNARNLTSVYGLSSYDPRIVDAVCMLKSVGLAEGLARLSADNPDTTVRFAPAVLTALENEVKERGFDVTFDFLRLIHARAQRYWHDTGTRVIDIAQYTAAAGLTGILRGHVDQHLEALEVDRPGSEAIGRAILHRVFGAQSRGAAADFHDIGPRFDASDADVDLALRRLNGPDGLIAEIPTNPRHYQFTPPQVAVIVEADIASREVMNERGRRIVEEGLRGYHLLGTYLPAARFAEIHHQRHHLVLNDDLVRFLLQNALQSETGHVAGASSYWFRRMASHDDAVDVLLAGLFDPSADVRARAATLLGSCDDELVRDRLCVLALSDEAPAVRAAAIASLARMVEPSLLTRIRREVENPTSPMRENAISALQLFPEPGVSTLLQQLVADHASPEPVRAGAISVLSMLGITESVDALVDIALTDKDADDRAGAGQALARTRTQPLNRHLLSRLSWRRPRIRITTLAVVAAIVLVPVALLVNGALVVLTTSPELLVVVFGLMLVFAPVVGTWLRAVARGAVPPRSPRGLLAFAALVAYSVTVALTIHGLAHMMLGRTRRGLMLLGLQALGVLMLLFWAMAGATEIPGLGTMAQLYFAVGVALIVASYLYDVLSVLMKTFLLRGVLTRESRRGAIYREVLGNPEMAETVFAGLRGGVAADARRSKDILHRFGAFMLPGKLVDMFASSDSADRPHVTRALATAKDDAAVARLEALWPSAPREQRWRIVRVLARKPTARSVEALGRVGRRAGPLVTLRAVAARLQFRLGVWPLGTQLTAVAVIPVIMVLLYHGGMIAKNHAWGEIILLRQKTASNTRRARIVAFLADVYQKEAGPELLRQFREGRNDEVDSVHAALATGLVTILDSGLVSIDGAADALAASLPRFAQLLNDSVRFDLGKSVLARMAGASDSALAARAVAALVSFDTSSDNGSVTLANRKREVVRALAAIPYERALPALDEVLKARLNPKSKSAAGGMSADSLRAQLSQVAKQAYATIPASDRGALLALLRDRAPNVTDLIAQLDRELTQDRSGCGGAGAVCNGKVEALRLIAARPLAEEGYRDLLTHYSEDSQFDEARSAFIKLAAEHPTSPWPEKILAEIEHEHLSATDPAAFERSYEHETTLRSLNAYRALEKSSPADFRRAESDYAEVSLSARHFSETDAVAQKILDDAPSESDGYNMTLFMYMAAVMAKDVGLARTRLTALEAVVAKLPPEFYNNWVYPGTLVFIANGSIPDDMKAALKSLCTEGRWPVKTDRAKLIVANRTALERMGK